MDMEIFVLQALNDLTDGQVHVVEHGLVYVPGRVGGLRDLGHGLGPRLERGVSGLEGEVEEERLVVPVGIQVPGVRHSADYIQTSLFK